MFYKHKSVKVKFE